MNAQRENKLAENKLAENKLGESKSSSTPDPTARWRNFADWAKRHPGALRLADRLGRGTGRWRWLDGLELRRLPPAPVRPDLSDWATRTLSAVWLGHASVLLRIGGKTVLTDPVLSQRVGFGLLGRTAGPRRLVAPTLRESELPPIDLVLLSHAHFDHYDLPTLRRLREGPGRNASIITSRRNGDLVAPLRYREVIELEVGERAECGVGVTALPVKHWGARVFFDNFRGACAFLIESLERPGRRVLFGADTAMQDGWAPMGQAGGVDLAIVGIGAYDPWVSNHATPEQAAEMARQAGARAVLPMHHSTFKLSYEPMGEPMERFRKVVPAEQVAVSEVGGEWKVR